MLDGYERDTETTRNILTPVITTACRSRARVVLSGGQVTRRTPQRGPPLLSAAFPLRCGKRLLA